MIKQFVASLFTFLGVTLICFFLFYIAAGDPAANLSGKNASPERIESIRIELGLDQSLLHQYADFLIEIIKFDWGESWQTRETVTDMLKRGIGPSLSLTLPGFILSLLISLALALWSVRWKQTGRDRSVMIACLGLMSISFLVYIIVFQYFLAYRAGFFPVSGWPLQWQDRWEYLMLPWLVILFVSIGPNILLYRTILISITTEDYVVTAQSKGVGPWRLYAIHILKNGLVPIGAAVFSQIPFLFTGSLLLEAYFGIPGVGGLLVEGLRHSDLPVIKAMTLIGSLIYIVTNLLADFIYQRLDPRIRLS